MLIELKNVRFSYAGDPVLGGVSLSLHEGERVGLVGGNGAGKTTLLKVMLGLLSPEEGERAAKNGVRIGYLEQSGGFESARTVYDAMKEVFAEDEELLKKLDETQAALAHAKKEEMRALSDRLDSLQRRIAARNSYHYEVKIRTVLGGMGFGNSLGQAVSTASGGEKTRLKLCRLLLEEPDLLVLDEPTNHLDLNTLFWLEDYLSSYKGALFLVSHDRYFLDKLTTRTLELERGKLYSYKGNYSASRGLREERIKTQRREYEKQQEEIARLREYVDRNLVRATTAKSALSRVNRLERMDVLERPLPPPEPPRFRFEYDEKPYERVLSVRRFDLKAGGKTLASDVTLNVMRGERVAVVGDNGTGKSTLLKFLLSGAPEVSFAPFVRTGYYDQENADLDPAERVLDAFWGEYPRLSQTEARAVLARAGLGAEDVQKRVGELSGGMRAKLELARLEGRRGNFLILDEPTNHLDLPAREALEDALKAFGGTLLFVSHDRRFIESLATRIVSLEDGKLLSYEGSYAQFTERKRTAPPAPPAPKPKPKTEGHRSAEERAREARMRARVKEIEGRLEALEREEAELNEALAKFAADYGRVREIAAKLNAVRAESEALYEEYGSLI